jgi:DNA-directed RNA polymerase specialized sigma24 family protein
MLFRDGHSLDTAVAMLQSRPDAPESSEIRRLADQLPVRYRRQMVDVQTLDSVANVHFDDPVERSERERASRGKRRRLADAIKHLAPEDRRLLNMRYRQGAASP